LQLKPPPLFLSLKPPLISINSLTTNRRLMHNVSPIAQDSLSRFFLSQGSLCQVSRLIQLCSFCIRGLDREDVCCYSCMSVIGNYIIVCEINSTFLTKTKYYEQDLTSPEVILVWKPSVYLVMFWVARTFLPGSFIFRNFDNEEPHNPSFCHNMLI
jgi:hypothetical protein